MTVNVLCCPDQNRSVRHAKERCAAPRLEAREKPHVPQHQDAPHFEPPATDDEVRAAALQFVRKLSGTTHPSKANAEAFERAIDEVTHAARHLLASLHTAAPPRDRAVEAEKARAKSRERFARVG